MLKMTPIIKPVGDYCNQKCTYCFYYKLDQDSVHILETDLLEKFIAEYLALFDGKLSFIWHGGEPLLAGLDFFHDIVRLQRRYLKNSQEISNHIQTNATLITDDWAKFFKRHKFRVGISLDGNEQSHNLCRLSKNGRGTFSRVRRGLSVLEQYEIKYGVVQVMTKQHIPDIEDNFMYFANELRLTQWSINVFMDLEDQELHKRSGLTNQDYADVLNNYFKLWITKNNRKLKIREVENFICGALKKRSGHCAYSGTCTSYFCLNYDGKIFPCDSLTDRPELCFGDLSRDTLFDIMNSSIRKKYVERVNKVHSDCCGCEWFTACHNGCTSQRLGGVDGKYYYCDTRKKMFKYAEALVKDYV